MSLGCVSVSGLSPGFLPGIQRAEVKIHDFFPLDHFSVFLGKIKDAFDRNPQLQNLLLDDFFKSAVEDCQVGRAELGAGNFVFSLSSLGAHGILSLRKEAALVSVG